MELLPDEAFSRDATDSMIEGGITRLETQIRDDEQALELARSMRQLVDNPGWKRMREILRKSEAAYMQQLLSRDLKPQDLGCLQGHILMIRRLQVAAEAPLDQVDEIEKRLPGLRSKLAELYALA